MTSDLINFIVVRILGGLLFAGLGGALVGRKGFNG